MPFSDAFIVSHDHPALAAYRTGGLDVPEVVILEEVMGLVARHEKLRVTQIISAKFKGTMRSGVPCKVACKSAGPSMVEVTCKIGRSLLLEALFSCAVLAEES